MKQNPANQARLCAWAFEVNGRRHMVEIEKAYDSGKHLVWLDGALVPLWQEPTRMPGEAIYLGILGCQCELVFERNATSAGTYRLRVEGREVPPLGLFAEELLRPSSAPSTANDLLRPAGAGNPSAANELLRPLNPDADAHKRE